MDLSVVIISWNTREMLDACLASVYATRGLDMEVFVVDNASADGSGSMVHERYPRVHLIQNAENRGFAAANNQAIALAQGRYVLLLNSDTVVTPGAFGTLVEFMDAHPRAGAVGPYLANADGSLQPSCYRVLTPWREFWRLLFLERLLRLATYPMQRWDRDHVREVEVLKGACLLLRAEALAQVGALDERYFVYTEEMDLCARLLCAGWHIYWEPKAQVVHFGEQSTKQVADAMYVQLYRSKVQFQRKMGGEWRALCFKTLLALAYLPRFLAAGVASLVVPSLVRQRRTYGRLLSSLPRL